jgi:hypothetical protein
MTNPSAALVFSGLQAKLLLSIVFVEGFTAAAAAIAVAVVVLLYATAASVVRGQGNRRARSAASASVALFAFATFQRLVDSATAEAGAWFVFALAAAAYQVFTTLSTKR